MPDLWRPVPSGSTEGGTITTYLVERYAPVGAASDGGAAVLRRKLEGLAGDGVRHLRSTLLPTDEVCLSLVEAPSAEAVEAAFERAGLRVDRVTEAVEVTAAAATLETKEET